MQPRLLLFCGIPGSGKTTIATIVAQRLPRAVLVQTDGVRAMIAHPRYAGVESRFVYGAALAIAREALRSRYDAILDGTFPREEFRKEALSTLSRFSASQLVVHVKCDPELALQRNATRKDPVPEDTIVRIYRNFEPPRSAVILDTAVLGPAEAATKLLSLLGQDDS